MTFVCPYCFEKINFSNTWYRCKNGHEAVPVTIKKKKCCPECKEEVNQQICKQGPANDPIGCSKPLPYGIDQSNNLTLAVVGPAGVGKTQFITVLIHELQTDFAKEFGTSVSSATDATNKKQNRNAKYLYGESVVVPQTNSIKADAEVGEPYLYFLRKPASFNRVSSVTLTLYDTAGEDLNARESISNTKICKYLGNADGVIYLVDPLQIDYVRANLSSDVPLPIEHDVTDVLERITGSIRSTNKTSTSKKISTNLAIVFTKCDVLLKNAETENEKMIVFDDNSCIRIPRKYRSVDMDNIDNVSSEVEDFVDRITESRFTTSVNMNYSSYKYFITSALGQNDVKGRLSHRPIPFRIEDAILWLLSVTKNNVADNR